MKETRASALENDSYVAKKNVLSVDGNLIIPLFDPPHLLQCIRNNLLTKELSFCQTIKKNGK